MFQTTCIRLSLFESAGVVEKAIFGISSGRRTLELGPRCGRGGTKGSNLMCSSFHSLSLYPTSLSLCRKPRSRRAPRRCCRRAP